MIDLRFGRGALGACVAIAMLVGCGAPQLPTSTPSGNADQTVQNHKVFRYTPNEQRFKVPAQVTEITVVALGASGGYGTGSAPVGPGGEVKATIPVTPRETLYVFVGGDGAYNNSSGGFNGGALGGLYPYCYRSGSKCYGYGGGGASDVREGGDSLRDRILVAGGGGGAGTDGVLGGGGGGKVGGYGGSGNSPYGGGSGGGGGTQNRGGSGGAGQGGSYGDGGPGSPGTLGDGGSGGQAGYNGFCSSSCFEGAGGGGGGGYYGGGGGGGACAPSLTVPYCGVGGGGGGGSSYVEKRATHVTNSQGTARPGNGKVTIYWHYR